MPRLYEEETAARVARRLGLAFKATRVLDSGGNVLIHLRPAPVVARVTRLAHLIRPVSALAGSIALARSESLREIVIPPTTLIDPGPHVEDGRYVTFWTYSRGRPATPSEAGSSLRRFHEAAHKYAGRLRSFDPRPEALRIAELVDADAASVLRATVSSVTVPELPPQPIHGDAHLGNVLVGGVWQDLDEVCAGPREWDLACLQHRRYLFSEIGRETEEALGAYGPHDQRVALALAPLVVVFTAAWGSLAPLVGEEVGPRTRLRLDWLRERYG